VLKKKRFVIGGIIILATIVFLGYQSFRGAATYYYEVSELLEIGDSLNGRTVRVSGLVAPQPDRDLEGLTIRFTISDNRGKEASLPVVYHGIVPDTFKAGRQVVLEGHYNDDVFTAKSILTKCASRYEPAK